MIRLIVSLCLLLFALLVPSPYSPSAAPTVTRNPGFKIFYLAGHYNFDLHAVRDPSLRSLFSAEGYPDAVELTRTSKRRLYGYLYYVGSAKSFRVTNSRIGWTISAPEPLKKATLVVLARNQDLRARYPQLHVYPSKAVWRGRTYSRPRLGWPRARGDVYLTAKQGETIRSITKKYTGSTKSAKAVARVNKVGPSDSLKDATIIRIPGRLLKK